MTKISTLQDTDPTKPEEVPRGVTLRLMTENELPLMVEWLNRPHVAEWFHDHPATPEAVVKKYQPRIDGNSPTKVFTVVADSKPIGMVQAYQVHDYPEYADNIGIQEAIGVDLFIGEPDYLGKGYGRDTLETFVGSTAREHFGDTQLIVASPSINNPGSIKAFEAAGFTKGAVVEVPGEQAPEQVMTYMLAA